MSSDMISYLLYMQTWDNESDGNIDAIVSEHSYFVKLGDYDSDEAVNKEFKTVHDLACEVRDLTIAADATQIAADAAAVASIWSFGLGMAAFAALEAAEVIQKKVISSKSEKLNKKMATIDMDIAANVNSDVKTYVEKYKSNNNLIASKAAKGTDVQSCRSNLMQFLAQVEKQETLTADAFRKYAHSARVLYNSDQINDVYDALDKLNFSAKDEVDVKECMNVLVGLNYPESQLSMVRNFAIAIMYYKLNVANTTIKSAAKEAGIPVEEVDATAFEVMDAAGKFVAVVAVAMSVVDVVFEILDIVDVVKQCNTMCDKLDGKIKPSYLDYFNGMKEASQKYNKAIASKTSVVTDSE